MGLLTVIAMQLSSPNGPLRWRARADGLPCCRITLAKMETAPPAKVAVVTKERVSVSLKPKPPSSIGQLRLGASLLQRLHILAVDERDDSADPTPEPFRQQANLIESFAFGGHC